MGKTSVWPSDFFAEPHEIERQNANHLVVFLICPFSPEEQFQELLTFCNEVCRNVGDSIGANVECVRADSFSTPKVIHEDIWCHIHSADALIVDVSGTNGNVMLELGVAAAIREKEYVIIIHDEDPEYRFLFDISPARHLSYRRSVRGDSRFREQLANALLFALAPAPYVPPSFRTPEFPVELDLATQDVVPYLLSPSNAHRRHTLAGLEFGSFHVFRYSWISLGLKPLGGVRVRAEMRFLELRPGDEPGGGWIGIMLRGQHFFANLGHVLYVISDGTVKHTEPISEFQKQDSDPTIGSISQFKLDAWIVFDLKFDESGIAGTIGDVDVHISTQNMPYVHNAGILRIQSYRARAVLRQLQVERLD